MKCSRNYGYEKTETENIAYYIKGKDHIELNSINKTIHRTIDTLPGFIGMEELKAINTKVKELGWEE